MWDHMVWARDKCEDLVKDILQWEREWAGLDRRVTIQTNDEGLGGVHWEMKRSSGVDADGVRGINVIYINAARGSKETLAPGWFVFFRRGRGDLQP